MLKYYEIISSLYFGFDCGVIDNRFKKKIIIWHLLWYLPPGAARSDVIGVALIFFVNKKGIESHSGYLNESKRLTYQS